MYFEGNSSRAVGRFFNIGKETCLRWIKAYANKIKQKKYKNSRIEVIEMDELYSFISEKKKRLFLIVLLDRYRRKIVGYDISYDKNPETIQKIIDTSPKANQYYSDGYTGYFNLNYHGGSYKSFNNKSQTHNIESVNSELDISKEQV